MDSWIAAAFESQGLWITIYSFLRDKWAFWNEFWCIYFPFELWMLIGDIQEAEDWKKQFISRLYMHYIPICHVANDHGANKEPDVHRWLKEVQLPGVLTHQVKLKEQPQLQSKQRNQELAHTHNLPRFMWRCKYVSGPGFLLAPRILAELSTQHQKQDRAPGQFPVASYSCIIFHYWKKS